MLEIMYVRAWPSRLLCVISYLIPSGFWAFWFIYPWFWGLFGSLLSEFLIPEGDVVRWGLNLSIS